MQSSCATPLVCTCRLTQGAEAHLAGMASSKSHRGHCAAQTRDVGRVPGNGQTATLVPSKWTTIEGELPQRTPWGGGKKRGVENLTNDTPPRKGFWTPLVRYVFHPPHVSVLCFSCTEIHDRADQKLFWRGPNFRESAFSGTFFHPPYVLHPPISRPNFRRGTRTGPLAS